MDKEKIVEKYGTDITKLNIGHVKKWVRALRSRKYKKTEGTLHYEDQGQHFYCALGVAAKVAGLEDEELNGKYDLPGETRKWLGLESSDPIVHNEQVSMLNDNGKSFSQIAHLIEHFWIEPYEKFKHCFLKQGKGK